MRNYFEEINENLLTGVHSRPTLGQVRDYYRLKSQGRTALLFAYLKLNIKTAGRPVRCLPVCCGAEATQQKVHSTRFLTSKLRSNSRVIQLMDNRRALG